MTDVTPKAPSGWVLVGSLLLLALAGCSGADDDDSGAPGDDDVADDDADDDTTDSPDDDTGDDDTAAWGYPWISTGAKLGVHGIYSTDTLDYAQQLAAEGLHFPVVKAVDDLWWLAEIKSISPETITIARLTSQYEGCGNVEDPGSDLEQMADEIVGVIAQKLSDDPSLGDVVDYWELVNEPDPPGEGAYGRLAELMIECMERSEAIGLKTAIFSLNAGTPEWDEMVDMVDTGVFGRAKQGGHLLAIHEGVFGLDAPIDQYWGDTIPGSPEVEGAGAMCFRYRYLYSLLEPRDEVVPLVVSEFYAGGGYAGDGADPQAIRGRMAWYDGQAALDYWFWAFMPFTLGPSPGWEGQDYSFAYPALLEYMVDVRDRDNAAPP